MKSVQIVSISLPIKMVQALDESRNDISRSKFVQRMIEKEMDMSHEHADTKTDFVNSHSSDEATEENIILGKDTESKTKEIETASNSTISWLNR